MNGKEKISADFIRKKLKLQKVQSELMKVADITEKQFKEITNNGNSLSCVTRKRVLEPCPSSESPSEEEDMPFSSLERVPFSLAITTIPGPRNGYAILTNNIDIILNPRSEIQLFEADCIPEENFKTSLTMDVSAEWKCAMTMHLSPDCSPGVVAIKLTNPEFWDQCHIPKNTILALLVY